MRRKKEGLNNFCYIVAWIRISVVFGLKTKTKLCSVLFSWTCFSSDMLRVSADPSGGAGLRFQQRVCANGENMQDKMFVFWPVRPCKLVVKLTALSSWLHSWTGCRKTQWGKVLLESPAAQTRPRTRVSLFSCGGVGVFPLCSLSHQELSGVKTGSVEAEAGELGACCKHLWAQQPQVLLLYLG